MKLQPAPDYVQETEGNFTFNENRWRFVFDKEDDKACQALNEILDRQLNVEKQKVQLLDLIEKYPKDIDIPFHVAICLDRQNKSIPAYIYTQAAASLALQAIPDNFAWDTAKIDYAELNNRPFFRAYTSLAYRYFEFSLFDKSMHISKRLVSVHPNDNLGARYTLAKCYRQTKDTEALKRLQAQYDGDDLLAN